MKKDIVFHPVKGVQVAIVRTLGDSGDPEWKVVVINRNDEPITSVFVTSKGYSSAETGAQAGQKTSTLRHFFAEIAPGKYITVETIMPDVFHLNNEYWISYFVGTQVYDKKFIFVPDSIIEDNLIEITPLGLEGILHE